jgi:hypothetical protein
MSVTVRLKSEIFNAIKSNRVDRVQELIATGINLNNTEKGEKPIECLVRTNQNIAILRLLVENGADPSLSDGILTSCLTYYRGNIDIYEFVIYLMNNGAVIDFTDTEEDGTTDMFVKLLKNHLRITSTNKSSDSYKSVKKLYDFFQKIKEIH